MGDKTEDTGAGRQPQQQQPNVQQQQPGQQQQQADPNRKPQAESIDTDGDGRTRDPNDKSPTDNGGRADR